MEQATKLGYNGERVLASSTPYNTRENEMNKKHFEVVAAAVANIHPRSSRWMIANLLANTFETEYPRFDRDMFIAACRPTED